MNTTAQEQIDAYVDAVREALVGLPEATRRELLEDLPDHLAEVLAEGGGPLTGRLGPPDRYAAELRAAAEAAGGVADPPPVDRVAAVRARVLADARRHLAAADVSIGPLLGHARASEFLTLLRPAWWVLRGYLAAMVLAHLLDDSGQPIGLLPRIGGSEPVALLLLGGAVLASVWLGRRAVGLAPWPRYALRAGTVLLVLVAVNLFLEADQSSRGATYQDTGYTDPYGGIEDIFVYDQQGRPLTGVHLFDQNGSPIRIGNTWCDDGGDPGPTAPYPHCPQNAPFPVGPAPRQPDVPARPAPEPSASGQPAPEPSGQPVPEPSASGQPTPSPTGPTGPAPGRTGADRPTPASPSVTVR